jgi:hypothetical protein
LKVSSLLSPPNTLEKWKPSNLIFKESLALAAALKIRMMIRCRKKAHHQEEVKSPQNIKLK